MKNYKEAKLEGIIADAKERGVEAINFLKELSERTEIDKNGTERRMSYVSLKKAYFTKYYPEMIPAHKQPKQSMYDLIQAL